MVEIKFTVDDNFSMDELKCIMAYDDFVSAIFQIRQETKEFWELPHSEEACEEFVKRLNWLTADLPTLP